MMKKLYLFCLMIGFAALTTFQAAGQAGTLDVTFDGDGKALFDLSGFHETAWDLVTLPDTTTILCGTINVGSWTVTEGYLMRLNPDGSQDMTWGTGGLVSMDYGEDTFPYNIELLDDGKFLVSGVVYVTVSDAEFFVARFLPDGTPDAAFGSGGVFVTSYTTSEEVCETMAVQADGKVVLAGRTYSGSFSQLLFARVNTDGTLDLSFGTNGFTEINASVQDERINGLTILSSGSIVGVGYGYQSSPWWGEQAVIAKLNPDGTPMTSFAPNGVMIPSFITDISTFNAVIERNDSLFITGWQYDPSNNQELLTAKTDSSGMADAGFGTGGLALLYLNPVNTGMALLTTSDQKVYVAGTTGQGGIANREFILIRYLTDGTMDPDFNGTGYVTTNFRIDWDEAYGVDIQPDGKLVCAGMSGGLNSSGNNDIPVARYLNDFIPSGLIADFSATPTLTCVNDVVSFTDQSFSTDSVVVTWQWSFEGGTPATSNVANPTVQYASAGSYDVQLIVYDGIYNDTLLKEDYIVVETMPAQPDMPSGPTDLCGGYDYVYETNPVTYADSYDWEVSPASAGTMVGTSTSATFETSDSWTGTCMIKVRGEGLCGDGPWSAEFQVELNHNPVVFQLGGDGAYCDGEPGSEITLDGSETGVDYELYLDGSPTGNVLAGTGSAISFGFHTTVGLYTALGYTSNCSEEMIGQVYVFMKPLPSQPSLPAGPDTTCNYNSDTYAVGTVSNADALIWTIDPPTAGQVFPAGLEAVVIWEPDFIGTAWLSVHGENECGDGPESAAFEIAVFDEPDPEINGPDTVCDGFEEIYMTAEVTGNFYTWEVSGGVVVDGAGTHQVTVLWGDPGAGTVLVIEETEVGCVDTAAVFNVTIEECTFLGENEVFELKYYPNPVKRDLYVDLSGRDMPERSLIIVLNAEGRTILENEVTGPQRLSIDVSALEPGIYFIHLQADEGVLARGKFIVVR